MCSMIVESEYSVCWNWAGPHLHGNTVRVGASTDIHLSDSVAGSPHLSGAHSKRSTAYGRGREFSFCLGPKAQIFSRAMK